MRLMELKNKRKRKKMVKGKIRVKMNRWQMVQYLMKMLSQRRNEETLNFYFFLIKSFSFKSKSLSIISKKLF